MRCIIAAASDHTPKHSKSAEMCPNACRHDKLASTEIKPALPLPRLQVPVQSHHAAVKTLP